VRLSSGILRAYPCGMEDCRLNDPSILAAWLDGTMEQPTLKDIDDHLLGGCSVCWSVLRFVGRLRELVGSQLDPSRQGDARGRPSVILDSEIMRLAMGLPREGAASREMLLEAGPWDAVVRIKSESRDADRMLEFFAAHRETHVPPIEAIRVEVRRGNEVLARADTDRFGQAFIPFACENSDGLRLTLRGPGVTPTSIALA
jgi:hypothetical protein